LRNWKIEYFSVVANCLLNVYRFIIVQIEDKLYASKVYKSLILTINYKNDFYLIGIRFRFLGYYNTFIDIQLTAASIVENGLIFNSLLCVSPRIGKIIVLGLFKITAHLISLIQSCFSI